MAEIEHLSEKKVDYVANELWKVNSSLRGLGSLFQYKDNQGDILIDANDFYGIGHLQKILSERLSVLEDILRCGCDSMAITKDKKSMTDDEMLEKLREFFHSFEEKNKEKNEKKIEVDNF